MRGFFVAGPWYTTKEVLVMKYVTLKNEKLSQLGLGTWDLGEHTLKRSSEQEALVYGLAHGVNVVDTAEMYGEGQSEQLVGEVLTHFDRQKLFVISKFYPWHSQTKLLRASLEASLKRLKTDYLDLYLLHWREGEDLRQVLGDLHALKKQGLIKHFGVSNFDTADLKEALSLPYGTELFCNEDLYNLSQRGIEYDLIPYQRQNDIGLIGYSPFNSGTGDSIELKPSLKKLAQKYQVTPHQIMLAWTMRDFVLTIPKASSVAHMKANLAAAELTLTDEDLALLDQDYPAPSKKEPLATI